MAIFTVGPNSTYPSIAAAMAAAGPNDTIQLEAGYSNETAIVTHSGMIITGEASSTGIVLQLGSGIATVTLAGAAPFDLIDAADGNGIVGNDGDNLITVTAGADSVSGGPGNDRLFVDYRLATGAVTGDSTSNVAEAGGGGRLVTINGGFEDFTIWTGSGADTITTGAGDDDIRTGDGAGTVTAGEGANYIVGGDDEDTITAGSGGNFVDGGDGANTITTGDGIDEILSGRDGDTIVAGAGDDTITILGGADTVDADAGSDLLIVDYSTAVTDVTGGVTGGNLGSGYTGHLADLAAATLDFVDVERFIVTTGTGNDSITTGAADDSITTGDGNDFLDGGGGADTLAGGLGNDLYVVDNLDGIIEASGQGFDQVYALVSYSLAAGVSAEVLAPTTSGSTNAINLFGNEFGQQIFGNAGANILAGGGGADALYGLGGDDTYSVEQDDFVFEGAGQGFDQVYVPADYVLAGGVEAEVLAVGNASSLGSIYLTGNAFGQTIFGNDGANVIDGGGGADALYGRGGDDIYSVQSDDLVFEDAGDGFDQVYSSGSFTLAAGAEVEVLAASTPTGTNALSLFGNELGQQIFGNAGDNALDGGAGADWLYGLGGADTFAFTTALGGGNVDAIADFNAADDTIALDDAVFTGLGLGALSASAFVVGAAAADADDRIIYNQATGQLLFDADGNGAGAAVQFATLQDMPTITANDFVVT